MEPGSKGTATVPCTGEVNRSERSVRRASRPRLCVTRVGRTVNTSADLERMEGRKGQDERREDICCQAGFGTSSLWWISLKKNSEIASRLCNKHVLNATADPASRATSTDESRQQLAAPPQAGAKHSRLFLDLATRQSHGRRGRSLSPSQTHRRPCRSRTRPRWTI